MSLTIEQFADYLRSNEGKEYLVEGTQFTFSLRQPREYDFPYSVGFSSNQWSKSTNRSAGARRIANFLAIFNDDPGLDWRDYKNRDGTGSTATTAKYLVHLMRKAAEPSGQRDGEAEPSTQQPVEFRVAPESNITSTEPADTRKMDLKEFDKQMRRLVPPNSRPFLCEGSPFECKVFIVGNNPGTDTPFWDYWELPYGCHKDRWLADFWRRHEGERKPVRTNMELIISELGDVKYLETNAYAPWSKWASDLKGSQLSTEIFDFLLRTIQPELIFAHGAESRKFIQKNAQGKIELDPKWPCPVRLLNFDTNVYVASKSLMYWGYDSCRTAGQLLRDFIVNG